MTHVQLLDFAFAKPEIAKPFFEKLAQLEYNEASHLSNLNGGFANAYVNNFYFDDEDAPYIEVMLGSGYQDERSSASNTETLLFDIQTLEWRE